MNNTIIKVKKDIYPLEAIYAASFHFIDDYYIHLDSRKQGTVEITIKNKQKAGKLPANLTENFFNELIYCASRIFAAKRNKKIREFIVGRALFSAVGEETAVDQPGQNGEGSYKEDPLGIAIPWEEKATRKKKKKKKHDHKVS
jgi:His-Xaa-Ser system protein HxsD